MLLNSQFDIKEMERERGVIVEEINMYEDNPMMYVDDLLEQIMYSGHPLGVSVAGTRESVKKMTRADLIGYKNKFYSGSHIVICLAGNFKEGHIGELKSKFKFKSTAKIFPLNKISIKQKTPKVALKFKETEQTQIALGFPAYSYSDKRIYALQLLSIILGGNMSSRLFLQVRERNGLAYFIRSYLSVYEDTGALIIQSGLDKSRVESAIKLIISELKKITKGVSAEELTRAKEYIYGKTSLDLEDTSHISQWYGQQELMLGRILTPPEKKQKIAAVTRGDIIAVAKDVININRASLAVIGPFKNEATFKNLLK